VKRMLVLGFAWSMLTLGVAQAVPARPRYEPPIPPAPFDLRGTVWDSKDVPEDRLIEFVPDGTLMYGPSRSHNGIWRLEGNSIYFELNDGYRMFRGYLKGDVIQGESWNEGGTHWGTTLYRVEGKKSP
jgi:hypothetical protein